MAPKIFINTYQRYKKQTDRIAQWLLDTAEQCGYNYPIHPTESKKKSNVGEAQPYRIRLAQFRELAAVIVNGKDIPSIPRALINLLKDTISLRKDFAQFFRKHRKQTTSVDADSMHTHFINKLEEVLDILKPACSEESPIPLARSALANKGATLTEPKNQNLDNRFSALEVEELDDFDLFQEVTASPAAKKSSVKPRQVVFQPNTDDDDDNADELQFAIYCFFEDLNNARLHLQKLWTQYKLGMISLEDVSLITNTTFDLARRADEELCLSLSHNPEAASLFSEPGQLGYILYIYSCMTNGVDPTKQQEPDDWFNYEMADLGQWLYLPMKTMLSAFCKVINPGRLPLFRKGFYGTYRPEANRSRMSLREKFAENKIVIMEALPDFCMMEMGNVEPVGQDELTKGLKEMCTTKKASTWLLFATQVFLDINHLLRLQVNRGLQELRVSGEEAKRSLKNALNFTAGTKLDNWAGSNNRMISNTIFQIDEYIIGDVISKSKRRLLGSRQYDLGGEPEPFHLFKRHPLLCGMMSFALTLTVREIGTTIVEAWGSILYTAYLYQALRQESALDALWPDMETFISIHTPEKLFVGGYPTTLEESVKKYYLMMGAAPRAFARDHSRRNKRGRMSIASGKGPRIWNVDSPILAIFKKRFVEMTGSAEWTVHSIERLLNEASQSKPQQKAARRRWEKTQQLTMLQLLDALQVGLAVEAKGLHFNYLDMHFKCIELLHTLRNELHEKFVHYWGPQYLEHDGQISTIAGYIIHVASESQKLVKASKELRNEEVGSDVLLKAGRVVKAFLDPTIL